jgi:hypothetical protein
MKVFAKQLQSMPEFAAVFKVSPVVPTFVFLPIPEYLHIGEDRHCMANGATSKVKSVKIIALREG